MWKNVDFESARTIHNPGRYSTRLPEAGLGRQALTVVEPSTSNRELSLFYEPGESVNSSRTCNPGSEATLLVSSSPSMT